MNNLLLFLFVCVPVRLSLVIGSYYLENENHDDTVSKTPFVVIASFISAGFFRAHYFGSQIGAFGGERYWDRLAHSVFYALYALSLGLSTDYAYLVLASDLVYGILTVLKKYS
jgi:hypothetical protein